MAESTLTSQRHAIDDPLQAIEFCFQMGWTDGLPVVPPTEARVREFLACAGKEPDEVIGTVPMRGRTISAEKAAINAVMAGCRPDYMPVVVAALEAMARPEFDLYGCSASTGGAAVLLIVSGPIAAELSMNGGGNVLGPGWRANATIGRAIRLILMNVCGATPGTVDRSTIGHPGKFTYCLAEDERNSPWPPLRVSLGFPAEVSTVTVMAGEAPHYVNNHVSYDPEGILTTVADTINGMAFNGGQYVLVIAQEHLGVIKRAGWSKEDVQSFVAARACRPVADLKRCGRLHGAVAPGDESKMRRALSSADDLLVVVAGGEAGGFSAVIPPWAGGRASLPQTQPIGVGVDCG